MIRALTINGEFVMNARMEDRCCVVLISYNPTQQIVENIHALISQAPEILIVDNASNADSLAILEQLSKEKSVTIKYNSTNLGIATALNQGVVYAAESGYEWVVTFDQDSLAPTDYIQTMVSAYHSCNHNESVAIISPTYQTSTGTISFSKNNIDNQLFSKIKTTITSGNIVRIAAIQSVGFFDDSFFIDYVDHEFCLRVRSQSWLIIESHKSILFHNLGDSTLYKIANINIVTTGHSAIRRYYKYRNLVTTLKKYYWFEPWETIVNFKSLIFEPLKILLFEEEKLSKIGSIFKGILDGVIGK
jgi:rhamnosyltransferase